MFRRDFVSMLALAGSSSLLSFREPGYSPDLENEAMPPSSDRDFWLSYLQKLSDPVLTHLSKDTLRKGMPVFLKQTGDTEARKKAINLEAFGRLMLGIAPWLQAGGLDDKERQAQQHYKDLALEALSRAADPGGHDYLYWDVVPQCLVDAAFLAAAFLHCPDLWHQSDAATQKRLLEGFQKTRAIQPYFSNWLLFSGMIEAFFCHVGAPYDKMRIQFCLRQHEEWYKGDGMFGDGPEFHFDYYNSFVIQPLMNGILGVMADHTQEYRLLQEKLDTISKRYAQIQERLIQADGSYPAIGRSICYRGGAFHHLAFMTYKKRLPDTLSPAQVRGALTAVMKKTTEHPKTFTDGWLNPGLYGYQPGLAETYISTGALYLASFVLLPLGLPPADAFWKAAPADWTSKKIWSGQDVMADHAL